MTAKEWFKKHSLPSEDPKIKKFLVEFFFGYSEGKPNWYVMTDLRATGCDEKILNASCKPHTSKELLIKALELTEVKKGMHHQYSGVLTVKL